VRRALEGADSKQTKFPPARGPCKASAGQQVQLTLSLGDPAYPRRVVFVVTDAATAQPLQAVALGC
jgi:hypothetical protein